MEATAIPFAPIWDDLATFDATAWRGKVDVITASIPCQPFSVAGRQRATKDERWIWHEVERVLDDSQAPILFLENVPAIRRKGLPEILSSLVERGYSAQWAVFGAGGEGGCGAPHRRLRFFLLAYSSGVGREIISEAYDDYKKNADGFFVNRHGASVADSNSKRLQGSECKSEPEDKASKRALSCVGSLQNKGREGLADSNGESIREFSKWDKQESTERQYAEYVDNGEPMELYWPPKINDRKGWEKVCPRAQPGIRILAHGHETNGVLPRTEQLRLLGNSVVPVQAAVAWLYLSEKVLRVV